MGLLSSTKFSYYIKNIDPPQIIIDEVIGMSIALFMIPKSLLIYFIALFIFRILDICKPSIIYRLQALPAGWGIMFDDIIAGIMTWIICLGILQII